ncbi:hypothetical protein IF1G_04318 [Cordyceps javanica]|uniref:Uncharacterized protein n=1 Tax=Cordyceps javanica TaxID=43265 RepID=A0A545W361_9HYPO|nr:hypothetical protein IF1G_04318 [Cordyceps javanica]TQW08325.1 hypothetical protein IF2G_04201 [Cordyceps javanica]
MSLTHVDPDDIFFTFSRLRPSFSCGRRVQDTLDALLRRDLRPEDLPPISVLLDPATGHLFSLNNRRLYVFKALRARGRLDAVPVRLRPVPQTKRMKDKYTADKCAKTARLMLERDAPSPAGHQSQRGPRSGEQAEDEDEDKDDNEDQVQAVNADGDGDGEQQKAQSNSRNKATQQEAAGSSVASVRPPPPPKPSKPLRNMDDWTDEEDIGKKKRGARGKKGR